MIREVIFECLNTYIYEIIVPYNFGEYLMKSFGDYFGDVILVAILLTWFLNTLTVLDADVKT